MQDAQTKRETRRRKILENSEKRLQKITRLKYADNEIIPEYMTSVTSPNAIRSSDEDVSNTNENSRNALYSNTTNHNLASFLPSKNHSSLSSPSVSSARATNGSPKIWKKLGFKLVLLAVIVRIVHIFQLGYVFGETVVIPFSLFMMTQLGSCQFDQNMAGITGPVLLFFGVSPNKIRNLLICYNVVTSILIYFGIYFFTFVLAHLICVIIFGL